MGRGAAGGGGGACGADIKMLQHMMPSSPANSVSSDTAPGWAERAGLTGGVTAACTAASPLGREVIVGEPKGDREVPRFLRPVILLLTLSLLAIVGRSALKGREVGVVFGPSAVLAAGGVQLPEEVVDDIFDRADKDRDGVIAGEEIRHVSGRAFLFALLGWFIVYLLVGCFPALRSLLARLLACSAVACLLCSIILAYRYQVPGTC